ncbi:MAG: hypothetical protein ABI840_10700 [bacterium]
MKTNFLFTAILLSMIIKTTNAQLPHTSQPPPVNPGGVFMRSMIVDCTDDIISDISNGNVLQLEQGLFKYMRDNYIGYIILSGLEHANVFGNMPMENALYLFLIHARDSFPKIKIGLGASDAINFTVSAPGTAMINTGCFPTGTITNLQGFNSALNNTGINSANLNRSEMCKFFLKAAIFVTRMRKSSPEKFKYLFDSFFLEYKYWNYTTSLISMQNEFANFKTLLSVMKILKCNYNCVRYVEAEFLPSEIYTLQAWTAIDQITEADPLIDMMMIPAFNNNATILFDQVCKTMHFLTDRFLYWHECRS